VVDDDRLNRRILSRILLPEGFEVIEADSGENALELYTSSTPDLVLLDVLLRESTDLPSAGNSRCRYGDNAAPVIFYHGQE